MKIKFKIEGYKCNQCNHIWRDRPLARKDKGKSGNPKLCPKCKSPYWDERLKKNILQKLFIR